MQPAKGRSTENKEQQMNKWCELTMGVKAKRRVTKGRKRSAACIVNIIIYYDKRLC
jgi:hypothetical protein